jgi:hypothetical protein
LVGSLILPQIMRRLQEKTSLSSKKIPPGLTHWGAKGG